MRDLKAEHTRAREEFRVSTIRGGGEGTGFMRTGRRRVHSSSVGEAKMLERNTHWQLRLFL